MNSGPSTKDLTTNAHFDPRESAEVRVFLIYFLLGSQRNPESSLAELDAKFPHLHHHWVEPILPFWIVCADEDVDHPRTGLQVRLSG